ncbi:putative DNA-3-methyladenine glycosylase [Quillaja saponaria]|uniref:DNA-3-methyladenine glycosylase n=1 Tax=Quillaja saponaria TaxID=32244 RepID=A0AAD7PTB2_QUISA|nr:putative DNA-3-methyladenine glycosylase [Quillaja saponaria]
MSVMTKLQSSVKPVSEEPRAILGPAGNRGRVSEEPKRKNESLKNLQRPKKQVPRIPESIVQNNLSVDSSCSSDSTSSGSSTKIVNSRRTVKRNGVKPAKVVPDDVDFVAFSLKDPGPIKRCDWITPNSDCLYTAFHDEEWGVPVHEDRKLFELLVFSQALAELNWLAILNQRDIFRKLFENFDPSSVAQFTKEKLLTLKINGIPLLSEQKLRAVVENAKRILKVQHEFGSFSNYCWGFVNHKPIRNQFRYGRQVPVKTPKAEFISKDLMHRGFCCVGPTVVYSFMQVAGLVNDHLLKCFRYCECNATIKKELKPKYENEKVQTEALENKCSSND